ncbi:restriction endonuclease subunit S [Thermoflavifilum thermophilum]|uniref:Type I restriction enzyme, S subunit n=1 Tax=Thermoflavifilum thermophilum TaxID=1393122 RepID=A0A1I7NI24_9BACT|nr:restriction endonuclease subunit S [Thermoflavifilum thermophilum]SFV34325.1 type I restriction enzyme, S subunit [Thermoflavifilum thermophilum]
MKNLKPYPAYKDTSIPWLGKVPKHWEVMPNRALLKKRKKLVGNRYSDYQMLSLTKQGIIIRDLTNLKGKFSSDLGTSQEVRPGDLVFCLFDIPETPRTIGLSRYLGMITSAYTIFEPIGICLGEFIERFYIAMDDRKLLSPLYTGLRNTIPTSVFLQIKTPLPPLSEQTAIVRFLDYMDSRIRKAIRLRKKRISLLEEYKQALISEVVTGKREVRRTHDPQKPYELHTRPPKMMKDSGIPWLGQVPKHWEVRRLKSVCFFIYGDSLPGESRDQGSVPVYGSNGCVGYHSTPNTLAPCIIIGRKGSFGKVRYSTSPVFAIDTTFFIDSRHTSADLRWLFFLLGCLRLDEISKDSAVPGLDREDAYKNYLPLPPLSEQTFIAEYLDYQIAKIESAIASDKRIMELLEEYRTRLIADVVTGKVDVRDVAAQLPEALPEDGTADEEMADEETDPHLPVDVDTISEQENDD